MVANELVTLAEAGANVMVTAMATDAWSAVKSSFTSLLARGNRTESIEEQLASSQQELTARTTTAETEAKSWQRMFRQVLEQHEDAIAELRDLVADTRRRLATPGIANAQTGAITNIGSSNNFSNTGVMGDVNRHPAW